MLTVLISGSLDHGDSNGFPVHFHPGISDMKKPTAEHISFKIAYVLLQWTWGFIQTFTGALIFLLNVSRKHHFFCGCIVTSWKPKSSLSLGAFIFVSDDPLFYYSDEKERISQEDFYSRIEVHEYGHTIQSLILGPLYLFVVGITSITWATLPYFVKKREENGISYFAVFPENQANRLGEITTGKKSPGMIV